MKYNMKQTIMQDLSQNSLQYLKVDLGLGENIRVQPSWRYSRNIDVTTYFCTRQNLELERRRVYWIVEKER